ncbi:MAG: hypothetical protein F6K56_34110 [Moorea sp. SIO3G5]|nr:hypothetical protein [Moorena sp. SIO3G5]
MANININDISALNLTGADLFNDSESFMIELSEDTEQMTTIFGGLAASQLCPPGCSLCTGGVTIDCTNSLA